MIPRAAVFVIALTCAMSPQYSSSLAGNAQRPEFRAAVEVVSLNVTVTDTKQRHVTDLDSTDFAVLEDGARQEVTFFTRRRQPVALSLLIDSSASMELHLGTVQAAAKGFVRQLGSSDLAQVVDFDSTVNIRQQFTSNHQELNAGIDLLDAGGSTSLHNAIYIALKELGKVRPLSDDEVRRQAIVIFSDGDDTSSLVSFEQVLDLAKRSDTSIYAIALTTPDPLQRKGREGEYVMRSLAQQTGGRAFFPAKIEDLAGVYAQIADELATRYTLGFTSNNERRDGAWRRLAVQVLRPGLTARAKSGYFAPKAR